MGFNSITACPHTTRKAPLYIPVPLLVLFGDTQIHVEPRKCANEHKREESEGQISQKKMIKNKKYIYTYVMYCTMSSFA